ncbi:MAG: type II toxin-antitoxin system Phd/YefM family antitoxin [Lachnospiraceae bacterium]|nr:type II toxin-antitoxin system Phd/YefM family antitoxin [Ruminococcus sp.]MCM1274757.1 type II toxin-antitoxin system Phd/YefM family antitoxin [Lachnospiraceae bacterium]
MWLIYALVSINEANQNFSKAARLVDENDSAVILKNNVPRYIIMEFPAAEALQTAPDEAIASISERLIQKKLEAYKELAK